jgi:putative salt-induced outer membrane protein YdiY
LPSSKPLVWGCCALFALPVISARAEAPPKPDGFWRGAVNGGFSNSSGSSRNTDLNLSANAVRATGDDKLEGQGTVVRSQSRAGGVTQRTADLVRAGTRYSRDLNARAFGFGTLDLERDRIQQLEQRTVLGGGLGYHVIKSERLTFDLSTGLTRNHERFTTLTRDATEWLLAEESAHKLTDATSFNQRVAYYVDTADSSRYRTQIDAALATAVTERIALKVSLSHRYQNVPPAGVPKSDNLLLTTIGYRFGPD